MPKHSNRSGVVYQIRDTITGKLYVGSARYPKSRHQVHLHQLRKGTHHSVLRMREAWVRRKAGAA